MDKITRTALLRKTYALHLAADAAGAGSSERNRLLDELWAIDFDFSTAPGLCDPHAITLIESWPDPEAAHELLTKHWRELNNAFGLGSLGRARYFTAENNTLVMYCVGQYTWTSKTADDSPYRIELMLEADTIFANETRTGQRAVWREASLTDAGRAWWETRTVQP